jgi:hypothetical protein
MKDLFNHLKRVAIADTKLFFQPYVAVGRAIRSAYRFIKDKARKAIK